MGYSLTSAAAVERSQSLNLSPLLCCSFALVCWWSVESIGNLLIVFAVIIFIFIVDLFFVVLLLIFVFAFIHSEV